MEIGQIKKNCEKQRNFNNFNNLIYLTSSNSQSTYAAAQPSTLLQTFNQVLYNFVPRIMLSNKMSLVPKLVEIQEFLLRKRVDIGLIQGRRYSGGGGECNTPNNSNVGQSWSIWN